MYTNFLGLTLFQNEQPEIIIKYKFANLLDGWVYDKSYRFKIVHHPSKGVIRLKLWEAGILIADSGDILDNGTGELHFIVLKTISGTLHFWGRWFHNFLDPNGYFLSKHKGSLNTCPLQNNIILTPGQIGLN